MTVIVKRLFRSKNKIAILIGILLCIVLHSSHYTVLGSLDESNRESIHKLINSKIEKMLLEEKGTGCKFPKLDAFAREVTQFETQLPAVECKGVDWVKCYRSTCRVVAKILKKHPMVKCTYRDIVHESDHKYRIGKARTVRGAKVYRLKKSDHVKVSCFVGNRRSSWAGVTLGLRDVKPRTKPPTGKINIQIVAYDSAAKTGFIRRMPLSYKTLTQELDAVILNGYNIVGDGTTSALFPILTGKSELEWPDVRKGFRSNGVLDAMPFLFSLLRDRGWRTAFLEDTPDFGTFQDRLKGFNSQPVDHYLLSFFVEVSKLRPSNDTYCVGDTPSYALMLNLTQQFMELSSPRFGFTFIVDIAHDNISLITTSDATFSAFLSRFKNSKQADDTLLIVMGDHGPRFSKARGTLQGKQEERLPLMALYLPKKLRLQRPAALATLRQNVNTLATPFDLHSTLLDVLGMKELRNNFRVAGADFPRSLSLLDKIPRNRSCSEAGVETHWCACLKWEPLPAAGPFARRLALDLLAFINSLTQQKREVCAERRLESVESVMRLQANRDLLSFKAMKDYYKDYYVGVFNDSTKLLALDYQLKVVVSPGRGVYEATVKHLLASDSFIIKKTDISRINAYGAEPSCVSATHPHLKMYCYCKTTVQ